MSKKKNCDTCLNFCRIKHWQKRVGICNFFDYNIWYFKINNCIGYLSKKYRYFRRCKEKNKFNNIKRYKNIY